MLKNKIVSLFILIIMLSSFLPTKAAETNINISPVVQVISYYDIYGKYPMMMGWGSASVITKDGVIISNDHVVDDGKGALASAFSICITKKLSEKPSCDYTASLITRDDKLDISILRIDPIDIYGNKVDYTKFKTIDIDYDYEPKNQDETVAVGYPRIGADTISETKGIVSGVSEYNGYKYIKTDTLIAGGNSGGAFIRNGKLIGIPTFGIGGGDSMGYALSISEAKDFIEGNKIKDSTKNPITNLIDFNSYRKNIENINSSFSLKDDIFDIKLLPDYQVSNYIKNTTLNIELKKQKDTGVSYLSIYVEKGPKLDTDKKKFYYFEKEGFYNKNWQKLLKKNISGIEFYYPVDKTDLSAGDSNWGNSYKAVIGEYIITIDLQAPTYDEKRNKEVKKEIDSVLASIKINKDNVQKVNTNFSTNEPKIDITDFTSTFSDTGRYRFYLGDNLYEYTDIYLNELVEYNGKGKSAKEIFDVQLKDVDKSQKSIINFKGLDGFINCSGNGSIESYYNYYNYYDNYTPVDENGNTIELESCDINIFFPLNKELNRQNYLSVSMKSLKNNKIKNLDKIIKFITENIDVYSNSNEVNIPNILKSVSDLKFSDIKKQSTAYKNFLSLLVRYNMIENKDKFEGNSPITWGEFLDMYVRWIFNYNTDTKICNKIDYTCKFSNYKVTINGKEVSLDSIFKDIGVDNYNDFIDTNKINSGTNYSNFLFDKSFFDRVLLYKLAGINDLGEYTTENIANFEKNSSEELYATSKKKIENFINTIYGNKKILISDFYKNYEINLFTQKTLVYYPNQNKLLLINSLNNEKISFASIQSKKEKEFKDFYEAASKCYEKKTYLEYYNCNKEGYTKYNNYTKKYNEINENEGYYYYPLSKAEAIKQIFSQVDFGLFDTDLAKKKDTEVESNNSEE
ncbi:MAG: serine protease [Candidatus Gracilibacteria bacterium]